MSDRTMFELKDRVALITGAGFGLGREFARALAAHGATIACLDIDQARAETVGAELRSSGSSAAAYAANVADADDATRATAEVLASFGRIDVLINNAGIATLPARVHEIAVNDWDRSIAVNLRGTFLVTRAVLPGMLERASGSIINLSSMYGLHGWYPGAAVNAANYAASKAGIIGFTRQAAVEYARDGIRVNAIAPGYHGGTDLGRERRSVATAEEIARFESAITARTPMGRRGTLPEIQGLAVFLASDASSYITGQVFASDGGWTAG